MEDSYRYEVHDVLARLGVSLDEGLSDQEAQSRRLKYGRNALPATKGVPFWKLVAKQFEDLLVIILLVAAVISFILGLFDDDGSFLDAFLEPTVILIILIINAIIGVVQERNAESALESLREYEPNEATVTRGGHDMQTNASDLVPGDIITITVGQKVPADCRLVNIETATLRVDESMLTGEAEAVLKQTSPIDASDGGHVIDAEKRNMIFSGTLVVGGKASAVVCLTGARTSLGNIQASLSESDEERTPLQQALDVLATQLSKIILVICILVWMVNITHFTDPKYGGVFQGAVYYFKIAVALAVAAIPEGLPAVVTTCLALGTMKMAKNNAIVRSLPSVETLGCTTVICSDKTGTLTTNKMTVQKIAVLDDRGASVDLDSVDRYDDRKATASTGHSDHLAPPPGQGDHISPHSISRNKSSSALSDSALLSSGVARSRTYSNGSPSRHSASSSSGMQEYNVEGDSFDPVGRIFVDERELDHRDRAAHQALFEVGKISALCNEATLQVSNEVDDSGHNVFSKAGEATEAALLVAAEKIGVPDSMHAHEIFTSRDPHRRVNASKTFWRDHYTREKLLEFSRTRKSMSVVCREAQSNRLRLFCKGAPEGVLSRCSHVMTSSGRTSTMTSYSRSSIEETVKSYASSGLRVLAVAVRDVHEQSLASKDYADLARFSHVESEMTFVGLVGMMDPPRPEVVGAIERCRLAGMRVIVITGDHAATAKAICRRIGVFSQHEDLSLESGRAYEGREFSNLSKHEQEIAVRTASLFSRVEPGHKMRLVKLLKRQGEVVAMTGDGVNDAPALKAADIGVAMGSGTAVARDASDMVLQDDNFSTIVMAVEQGRSIFANTKAFIRYLISSNIGEVICIFLIALIGMPEALIPVQLLWVNLVTDGPPATALGFNKPDKDVMTQMPRGRHATIIDRWMFVRYFAVGLYIGVATVMSSIWWFMYYSEGPQVTYFQLTHYEHCDITLPTYSDLDSCAIFKDNHPSTMALSVLVTIEMLNTFNALSENQSLLVIPPWANPWVTVAVAASLFMHALILYVPFLTSVFSTAPLSLGEWAAVLAFSAPVILLDELLKIRSRRIADEKRRKRLRSSSEDSRLLDIEVRDSRDEERVPLASQAASSIDMEEVELTLMAGETIGDGLSTRSKSS